MTHNNIIKITISIICLCIETILFSQSIAFDDYQILNVGSISIPNNMEIQSGDYKKSLENAKKDLGYKISSDRVVFQQKGLNDAEKQGFSSYSRIFLETTIGNFGDFDKLTTKSTATPQEILDISKELRNQAEQSFVGTGLKLITWYGVAIVAVNGKNALKVSYLRQLNNNPYVVVNIYYFQNNDRLHALTVSYRQSDEKIWEPLLTKSTNSFKITNIR